MPLSLTNTLTGRKEEFKPLKEGQVSLYVCGVTVYDHCHIGHARGAVVFDVLRRYLESDRFKFKVTHVRNITDVDNKIIDRACAEVQTGLAPDLKSAATAVARRFEESFQADFSRLGLLKPTHEPRATEFIPKIIRFIADLIQKGMAYEGADGVYFSVRKFSESNNEYGKLSGQKLDQMLEGVRIDPGEGKKEPMDFALWKKAKPEEPSWESPWGLGRPGWHIECSTMSTDLLGDTFDIHGGGRDLIFPHHEDERAQSQGAGKEFARYWLHNGLLTVNGQKMSKSIGNIITIGEALKRHSADVLRMFFLSAHYRSPVDFTWDRLDAAANTYERFTTFLARADALGPIKEDLGVSPDKIEQAERQFHKDMEDDLNTPRALSDLFGLVENGNEWLKTNVMPVTESDVKNAAATLRRLGGTLGLFKSETGAAPEAQELARQRDEARRKKDFSASDRIRDQLVGMGYVVEDTAKGTQLRKRV